MTNGPERIWLDETSEDEDGFFICEGEKRHGNMEIEYIRADIHEARVKELEEAIEDQTMQIAALRAELGW